MGEAGRTLLGGGNPVGRRSAFYDVGDIGIYLAVKTTSGQYFIEQLTGGSDKRTALAVFLRTGPFADDQEAGRFAEDDLLTTVPLTGNAGK